MTYWREFDCLSTDTKSIGNWVINWGEAGSYFSILIGEDKKEVQKRLIGTSDICILLFSNIYYGSVFTMCSVDGYDILSSNEKNKTRNIGRNG